MKLSTKCRRCDFEEDQLLLKIEQTLNDSHDIMKYLLEESGKFLFRRKSSDMFYLSVKVSNNLCDIYREVKNKK